MIICWMPIEPALKYFVVCVSAPKLHAYRLHSSSAFLLPMLVCTLHISAKEIMFLFWTPFDSYGGKKQDVKKHHYVMIIIWNRMSPRMCRISKQRDYLSRPRKMSWDHNKNQGWVALEQNPGKESHSRSHMARTQIAGVLWQGVI